MTRFVGGLLMMVFAGLWIVAMLAFIVSTWAGDGSKGRYLPGVIPFLMFGWGLRLFRAGQEEVEVERSQRERRQRKAFKSSAKPKVRPARKKWDDDDDEDDRPRRPKSRAREDEGDVVDDRRSRRRDDDEEEDRPRRRRPRRDDD